MNIKVPKIIHSRWLIHSLFSDHALKCIDRRKDMQSIKDKNLKKLN